MLMDFLVKECILCVGPATQKMPEEIMQKIPFAKLLTGDSFTHTNPHLFKKKCMLFSDSLYWTQINDQIYLLALCGKDDGIKMGQMH